MQGQTRATITPSPVRGKICGRTILRGLDVNDTRNFGEEFQSVESAAERLAIDY